MKKTLIATKETENLGMHQVILTLDTSERTIHRKSYYDGKINVKETRYYEDDYILDISWNNEIKYHQEHEYINIYL